MKSVLVILALSSLTTTGNAQTLDCQKFRTGEFYYPKATEGYSIRGKKVQTSYFKGEMTVTWNVKWTSDCTFDLSFEKAAKSDGVFKKGDRIASTITAVNGDCYTFKSIFYNSENPDGQEIPPGQMCIKKD